MRRQRGRMGIARTIMALLACTGIEPARADGKHASPLPSALSPVALWIFIPPATGLVLGMATQSGGSESSSGDLVAAGMGMLVGVIAIEFIDSVFWARAPIPAPPVSLAVVPYQGGARLALGARF